MGIAIPIIAGLAVFVGCMGIVGNPHVVETVIGVAVAIAVGFFVWRTLHRL